jgi:tetratricopeptide (TPR) repeat protein
MEAPLRKLLLTFSALALLAGPALSAGTESAAPAAAVSDFTSVKAKLAANDYKGAITELTAMSATDQSADLYNYLGYASRKDGQLQSAAFYYTKALETDANHKGALAYQGELFLMINEPAKAKDNLGKLQTLCPSGCQELQELTEAIGKAGV